jgi:hypothetical protein
VNRNEILEMKSIPNEIYLVQDAAVYNLARDHRCDPAEMKLLPNVFAVAMGIPSLLQTNNDHYWIEWPSWDEDSSWSDWEFHKYTLEGAIIESLSAAWGASLTDVLACSLKNTDEIDIRREIAILPDGQKVEASVDIIRNPKASY